ncbi:hypothetical protein MBOT_30630 [Mycobacterium botniense]|uniref:Uncharacterized protein n=1 Tax=Mycobacterium botniense TaxID=84962 RepID=A0A7I9Y0W1_9MYCO|nr:hypothetical protein MBOT_30630 [Mycobacterium botniense]
MRSLTRVSVLMGPPWVVVVVAAGALRIQQSKYHAISKKALQKQGPVPTDRGLKLLRPPATCADQASGDACDRTAEPVWPTVGVALHLLYPASPGRSHRPV